MPPLRSFLTAVALDEHGRALGQGVESILLVGAVEVLGRGRSRRSRLGGNSPGGTGRSGRGQLGVGSPRGSRGLSSRRSGSWRTLGNGLGIAGGHVGLQLAFLLLDVVEESGGTGHLLGLLVPAVVEVLVAAVSVVTVGQLLAEGSWKIYHCLRKEEDNSRSWGASAALAPSTTGSMGVSGWGEAVVVTGLLPPQAGMCSFQSHLFVSGLK